MASDGTCNDALEAPRSSELRMGLIGGLMSATGPVAVTILTPAYPDLVAHFAVDPSLISATASLFFVGFALAHLVSGSLSDGLGRRVVGIAFFGLLAVATLAAMFAPTIQVFLLARFFQGIGASAGISISRALVRDLFVGQQSARVVNKMYIVTGAGPALAPIVGSGLLMAFGYRGILGLILIHALLMAGFLARGVPETTRVDLSRIRFRRLVANFGRLLRSPSFMLPSLAVAGVSGALYGQSAIIPFLLMDEIGLDPVWFGLAMFVHAGLHVTGSVSARFWLARVPARALVPFAQSGIFLAVLWMLAELLIPGHSLLGVIGPISLAAFSAAHSYPTFVTAGFNDFPEFAGAAASMVGFLQMGAGFLVGLVAVLLGDPGLALGLALGASLLVASASGFAWLRRGP